MPCLKTTHVRVERDLICHDGAGRGLGHLYVIDGQVGAMPDDADTEEIVTVTVVSMTLRRA